MMATLHTSDLMDIITLIREELINQAADKTLNTGQLFLKKSLTYTG